MAQKPLISIIVPIYNVEKYLDQCIQSLEEQTIADREIILVDDGSTDQSGDICDRYKEKYSDILVIHKENGGLASARNAGLDVARGQYVGFVDSDDYIANDMYESMLNAMKENNCPVACCNRYRHIDETEGAQIKISETAHITELKCMFTEEAIKYLLLGTGMTYSACDKLFKRDLFDEVRFPDCNLPSEDIPCIYKILLNCDKIVHIGLPKYYYRLVRGSISKSKFKPQNMSTFYYMQDIYKDVCNCFPALREHAMYAWMQSAASIYARLIRSGKKNECKDLKRQLENVIRGYLWRILKNSCFTTKAKIVFIIIAMGGYPLFAKMMGYNDI